jgi:hypothetical protein
VENRGGLEVVSAPLGAQVRVESRPVEHWNSANTVIFYGKDSELTGPDRENRRIHLRDTAHPALKAGAGGYLEVC